MHRYLRIYGRFLQSSLQRELEFRANFVAKILQNMIWFVFFLVVLLVVYSNTTSVAGWNRGEAFVLAACATLIQSVFQFFCFSLTQIPENVRKGTLDFIVTKPIDSQFWVSMRQVNFNELGSIGASIGLIIYGAISGQSHPSLWNFVSFFVLLVAGITIIYSFMLLLMTLGIWLVRVDNLWVLGDTLMQVARYPTDIYSAMIQRFFLFAIPVVFLATMPARALVKGVDGAAFALGLVWAGVLFFAARGFWNYAMRSYSSASS